MPDNQFRDLDQLPQFPAVATKLLRVLSHDDAHVAEIANFVRADAALASGLLRMANSALYARPARVTSIQGALSLLGFEEVKRYVLATSMKGCFQSAVRLDLLRAIWRHSLTCALLAEELSTACSATAGRDDQAYTSGLLHNIGRLGLFVAYPAQYAALLDEKGAGGAMLEREKRAFGVDHAEAGEYLARKWELPDAVRVAAATHHQAPGGEPFDAANVTRVAVLLADALGLDVTPAPEPPTVQAIRAMLPRAAQYRFDPDAAALKRRITDRLDAFD